MNLAARIIVPLIIAGGAGFGAWWLISTKPEPRQYPPSPPTATRVEATRLKAGSYPVVLETRGVVMPRTETSLIPEVSGRIIEISHSFREGGFFEAGDLLAKIDPLDYETAVVIAESNVAQAKTALEEERARGLQALENWKRLGKKGEPSELVLRKPQFEEMEARVKAAGAEVRKAKADLERTQIKAPYAGRILTQNVDVGQYVSPGIEMARLYAVDYVEIRLPLTNQQLSFADLPEAFRGEEEQAVDGPEVLLRAKLGGKEHTWPGKVIRVEGAIDERSRQLFIVAQVDDPYRKSDNETPPLKIGLFVEALVEGKELQDVFVLPRAAVRAGGDVILIDDKNEIRRQKVETLWSDRDSIVIPSKGAGLEEGQVVCVTPLAFPADGARVTPTIDGVAPETELTGRRPGKGKPGGKGGGNGPKGGVKQQAPAVSAGSESAEKPKT